MTTNEAYHSPYTLLENLLLFRNISTYGTDAASFRLISNDLLNHPLLCENETIDRRRLSADALHAHFQHTLREEGADVEAVEGNGENVGVRKRRGIAGIVKTPSAPDYSQYQAAIQKIASRFYDLYKTAKIREIQEEERRYSRVQQEMKEITLGLWDGRLEQEHRERTKTDSRSPSVEPVTTDRKKTMSPVGILSSRLSTDPIASTTLPNVPLSFAIAGNAFTTSPAGVPRPVEPMATANNPSVPVATPVIEAPINTPQSQPVLSTPVSGPRSPVKMPAETAIGTQAPLPSMRLAPAMPSTSDSRTQSHRDFVRSNYYISSWNGLPEQATASVGRPLSPPPPRLPSPAAAAPSTPAAASKGRRLNWKKVPQQPQDQQLAQHQIQQQLTLQLQQAQQQPPPVLHPQPARDEQSGPQNAHAPQGPFQHQQVLPPIQSVQQSGPLPGALRSPSHPPSLPHTPRMTDAQSPRGVTASPSRHAATPIGQRNSVPPHTPPTLPSPLLSNNSYNNAAPGGQRSPFQPNTPVYPQGHSPHPVLPGVSGSPPMFSPLQSHQPSQSLPGFNSFYPPHTSPGGTPQQLPRPLAHQFAPSALQYPNYSQPPQHPQHALPPHMKHVPHLPPIQSAGQPPHQGHPVSQQHIPPLAGSPRKGRPPPIQTTPLPPISRERAPSEPGSPIPPGSADISPISTPATSPRMLPADVRTPSHPPVTLSDPLLANLPPELGLPPLPEMPTSHNLPSVAPVTAKKRTTKKRPLEESETIKKGKHKEIPELESPIKKHKPSESTETPARGRARATTISKGRGRPRTARGKGGKTDDDDTAPERESLVSPTKHDFSDVGGTTEDEPEPFKFTKKPRVEVPAAKPEPPATPEPEQRPQVVTPRPKQEDTDNDGDIVMISRSTSPRTPAASRKRKAASPPPADSSDEETSLPSPAPRPPPPHSTGSLPSPITLTHQAGQQPMVVATKKFAQLTGPLLGNIFSHKFANLFSAPIKEKQAPGYGSLVYTAQDLKSIKMAVKSGATSLLALPTTTPATPTGDGPIYAYPTTSTSTSITTPATTANTPPKGIVNSQQLEKELFRMFANAVMYNKTSTEIVKETVMMAKDVESMVDNFRTAEEAGAKKALAAGAAGGSKKVVREGSVASSVIGEEDQEKKGRRGKKKTPATPAQGA